MDFDFIIQFGLSLSFLQLIKSRKFFSKLLALSLVRKELELFLSSSEPMSKSLKWTSTIAVKDRKLVSPSYEFQALPWSFSNQ